MESKLGRKEAEIRMSVARVTELSATSQTSFEDAINEAVARATKTLRGVEGCWVKDMNVRHERADRRRQHSWLQGQRGDYFRAGGVAPRYARWGGHNALASSGFPTRSAPPAPLMGRGPTGPRRV